MTFKTSVWTWWMRTRLYWRRLSLGFVILAIVFCNGSMVRAAAGEYPNYMPAVLIDYTWAPPGLGSISGTVTDALFNVPISGASVCLSSTDCVLTGDDGKYTISEVDSGTQAITALKDDYITLSDQAKVTKGQTTTLNFFLSPDLAQGNVDFRIVLTWVSTKVWGANELYPNGIPNDLDAHLYMRGSGQVIPIYPGESTSGDCTIFPYACMKQDVTNGGGPETIDIPHIELGYIYYFGVLNVNQYIGAPNIPNTKAVVRLYNLSGDYREFDVPSSPSAQAKDFWFLFEIDGSNGTLTEKNCIIGFVSSDQWTPTCE